MEYIVGGVNARKGEFPELVSIHHDLPEGTFHACGGTIYNKACHLTLMPS